MSWSHATVVRLFCMIPSLVLGDIRHWTTPGYAATPPHHHSIPCSKRFPDTLSTTWNIVWLNPTRHTSLGKRITTGKSTVTKLYREICAVILVKYDHSMTFSCPASGGTANYHLRFTRAGKIVLLAAEQIQGCTALWIEGHRKLGFGLGVLFLPPDVPTLY